MSLRNILTALAMASVVVFAGCKQDIFEEEFGVCPLVLSTSPENGATGVLLEKEITVTFNEKINPQTITQSSFTLQGTAKIPGELAYNTENNTLTFVPASKLELGTTYTGRVTTAVKDLLGNALQTDYVWTFSTGAKVAPVVTSTDPVNNATLVELNKTISATFSVAMDPQMLNATTFTLKQGTTAIAGAITYQDSTVTFNPANNLEASSVYTATISKGVKNTEGTALENDYTWTFTTASYSTPRVSSTDPVNQATAVALDKVIRAVFSEAMDPATITATSFTIKNNNTAVTGTLNYSGSTASFTPDNDLLENTTYTATITTAAKSANGIALANNHEWTFTTKAPVAPAPNDILKSVARFGIFAGVGISNNAGFSEIHNLDVGITPGIRSSVTGFPPAIVVNGAIYASDDIAPAGTPAMLSQAKQDLVEAYLYLEGATAPAPATVEGDQGGKTLAPGIYKSTSTLLIQNGNLTLDAQGDSNAVFIFQIASDFTTVGGAGGSVILTGGAQAKNIYWQTGSSATIGDNTIFKGNILALTSITMNSGATAEGRMLARNGSVVMTNKNIITKP